MKFVLFVEGDTEKKVLPAFLKKWLDTKLSPPVGVQAVRFEGWSELVRDTPAKTCLYLDQEDVIAIIALLDLYGPTIYPAASLLRMTGTLGARSNWNLESTMIQGSDSSSLSTRQKLGC